MTIPSGSCTIEAPLAPPTVRTMRPLTSRQERKLVDYLDEKFLQLTRNFKKRSEASSKLQTLPAYLEEARHMLAFILQIPPLDPSTSLRVAYLLRLTGDTLGSIPGYRPGDAHDIRDTLQDLADYLDDLDQAWVAVLKGQSWDPSSAGGVDLATPQEVEQHRNGNQPADFTAAENGGPRQLRSSPPSQTDLTRLKSLLLSGEAALEEWMITSQRRKDQAADGAEEDVPVLLSRMGLLNEFDSLFARTLELLGSSSGDIVIPQEAYTQGTELIKRPSPPMYCISGHVYRHH